MLVVAAGAFQGLQLTSGAPSDRALVAYGLIPELVARLTTRIVLPPPSKAELKARFLTGDAGIVPIVELAATLGVELRVAPEAVDLVVSATFTSSSGLSPRTGAGLLQMAARRALLDALDEPGRGGIVCLVGPDEVLRLLRSHGT
jgi:ATP-dependent protease Clp ATPase subunit